MAAYTFPLLSLAFLMLFAGILFSWQAKSTNDRGKDTKDHSERIYKDFDMFLKVILGLTTAFGYIRLDWIPKNPSQIALGRQALALTGGISMLVMLIFCIFIICHQASKIRRWENIEWPKSIFWQELWACIAMWVYASGLWIAAFIW